MPVHIVIIGAQSKLSKAIKKKLGNTGYCILFIDVMTNKRWIALILFIIGLVILMLPDEGKPVIVLNEKHRPSFADLVGLLFMITGWLWSCIVVFRNWHEVALKTGRRISGTLIIIYILSVIGIFLSLVFSSDVFLWTCAAIAALINL